MDVKQSYQDFLETEEGARSFNAFKRILYSEEDSKVKRIADIILRGNENDHLSILDIGGGNGKRLSQLQHILNEHDIVVDATIVEPSKAFVRNIPPEFKVIHAKYEDTDIPEQFDLALMIHSFYCFHDISYVGKLRQNAGIIYIAGNSPGSFLGGLKKIIDPSPRREIDQVVAELEQAGFTTKTQCFDTVFPNLLNKDHLNQKGIEVLNWMSLGQYDHFSKEKRREIRNYVIEHSHPKYTIEREQVTIATTL